MKKIIHHGVTFDARDYQALKDGEEEKDEGVDEEDKEGDEENDLVRIVAQVIASLPHSPPKIATSSGMETALASVIATTTDPSSAQSLFSLSQLQASLMEVSTTSSTKLQTSSSSAFESGTSALSTSSTILSTSILHAPVSTSFVNTSSSAPIVCTSIIVPPIITLILDSISTLVSIPLVGPIQVFTASPTISTIVFASESKAVMSKVEPRTPLKILLTGKEIVEDIDLDKEIIIPKLDLNNATMEQMRLVSQLLEQKARKKQLREERDKEFRIIGSAKNILIEAIGMDVDSSQHILLQLEEVVNKFNEDTTGQEKLLEKADKNFDNKVIEHIAQHNDIHQEQLSSILANLENSFTNVTSIFSKLCDVTKCTKEIKVKLNKIDEDLKASAQRLQLDPNSSSAHHIKVRFLSDMQIELLREEARIRSTLIDIQNMILPIMDTMQKHIAYSKTLIHDNNFSIADHMIELLAEVQVALHSYKILQENWDKTLAFILKVHSSFSHILVSLYKVQFE